MFPKNWLPIYKNLVSARVGMSSTCSENRREIKESRVMPMQFVTEFQTFGFSGKRIKIKNTRIPPFINSTSIH